MALLFEIIPHCSKANSYVSQCWTIQMRQAKSYLAFRCEIPKYIIHVILFAKGCISSTHYSCSYRSIISCCKWYRKYAYCYISRQTCRISPLWLESNGNPMSWIITAASKKRTWILVFSFQSPNFSSKCWSTCRLWHLQNRVHGIWKRYWENNRRNRSSPLWLAPNYNPVNIIRLGDIRSIWLICTSCNSSIRCRTSRAAPFARSRCNCKEHVCKWYW